MAKVPLHQELADLSGQNPAGYITTVNFSHLTAKRLIETLELLIGKELQVGAGALSAVLRQVNWSSTPPGTRLVAPYDSKFPTQEVDLLLSASLVVMVEIFITANKQAKISEVEMTFTDIRTHVRAENNVLVVCGTDFKSQRMISRFEDAEEVLAANGIDELEAARVEGHIGYGVVSQTIGASLGQRSEIDLAKVFPAVNFGTAIELAILAGGNALGILPTESVTLNPGGLCKCEAGEDLGVSRGNTENLEPADPNIGDELARVVIGGPIPDNKDPLVDFGRRRAARAGVAGLYIPRSFAQSLTVEVMPAIKVTASDTGQIGYRAEASVGFKNPQVTFDPVGGGILLDIDLDIDVSAYCDWDLWKGVRVPIGWAIISPAQNSHARIQVGFYPAVDSTGTVTLKSTLIRADMGSYVAVVIGIGTALKLIGVTAWLGFLIDVVLAAILSNGLPIALRKSIGKIVNRNWKLADGGQIGDPMLPWYFSAPYDVDEESMLASVDFEG